MTELSERRELTPSKYLQATTSENMILTERNVCLLCFSDGTSIGARTEQAFKLGSTRNAFELVEGDPTTSKRVSSLLSAHPKRF